MANLRPSGSNAISLTLPESLSNSVDSVLAVASHSLTVPSPPAEASRHPSGLNATLATLSLWPCKTRAASPPDTSQTCTILLPAAAASRWPSGLNARPPIPSVIVKCLNLASRVGVPDLGSGRAAHSEPSAVRTVCQATERLQLLAQVNDLLSGRGVADADRTTIDERKLSLRLCPGRTKGDSTRGTCPLRGIGPGYAHQLPAIDCVPNFYLAGQDHSSRTDAYGIGGEHPAVRAERQASHGGGVRWQRRQLTPVCRVPDLDFARSVHASIC